MDNQPVIPAMLADKEERMAARRARREARYAAKKGDGSDPLSKKGKGDLKKEESVSEKQIAESKQVLEREIVCFNVKNYFIIDDSVWELTKLPHSELQQMNEKQLVASKKKMTDR